MGKREILMLCLVIFGILFMNFGLSISSDAKQIYLPGETAIIKIDGNILDPLLPTQVEFKKNNVRMPFPYDLKKLGDNYYLWFIPSLNAEQANYTFIIHDVTTSVLDSIQEIDFVQPFSILGNISDYSIEPGFTFAKEDFSVILKSNADKNFDVDIDFPNKYNLTIKPGDNSITFSIKNFSSTGLFSIKIGKYNFLAYVIKNQSTVTKKNNSLDISPEMINDIGLIGDKKILYRFIVKNIGGNTVSDIYLDYDSNFFLIIPSKKITLLTEQSMQYNITLKSSTKGNISTIIYIKSDKNNISYSFPVEIIFVKNITEINYAIFNGTTNNQSSLRSCDELLGDICLINEKCSGIIEPSTEGLCCKGLCTSTQDKPSSAWIGYLIAAIVLLGLLFLYFKYKKVKIDKNPLERKIKEVEKNESAKKIP
ncbi:MAG: hypothetical protein AABX85_02595 [Nanoarchaeota archaeon]